MTSVPSLKGYRIGLLKDFVAKSCESRRKWNKIESTELVLKLRFEGAPVSYGEFKIWWDGQVERAREEKLSLILVGDEGGRYDKWQTMLKRIEEEEWDRGGEISVRFTTLDSLLDTLSTGSLPVDAWGDSIARGENVSIFHGDLFAIEHFGAKSPHMSWKSYFKSVIRGTDDVVIDFDPSIIEQLILQNGGILVDTFARTKGEDVPIPKICYVVTDGRRCQAVNAIISNPLLAKLSRAGVTMVPVNWLWVKACVRTKTKCDPKLYPILFQPQAWPVRRLNLPHQQGAPAGVKGNKFFVVVSHHFPSPVFYVIFGWLTAMGASAKARVSDQSELLICDEPNYCRSSRPAKKKGIPTVSLEWLYHTMQHGYETGSEAKFPTITVINIRGCRGAKDTCFLMKRTTPLSRALREFATRNRTSLSRLEFRFRGKVIRNYDATPRTLGLQDNDSIDTLRIDN